MTTSLTLSVSEIFNDKTEISVATRAYFQERLRHRLYSFVIDEFEKRKADPAFNQKQLAFKIGKRPDQVCRYLSTSGNWTLDSISDLLLGICGAELDLRLKPVIVKNKRNMSEPSWLYEEDVPQASVGSPRADNVVIELPKSVLLYEAKQSGSEDWA